MGEVSREFTLVVVIITAVLYSLVLTILMCEGLSRQYAGLR